MKPHMDCVACHSHRLPPPAELVVHIIQLFHLRRLLFPAHDVMLEILDTRSGAVPYGLRARPRAPRSQKMRGIPPPRAPTPLRVSPSRGRHSRPPSTPPSRAAAPTSPLCLSPPGETETGGEGAAGSPPRDPPSRAGPDQAATSGHHGAPPSTWLPPRLPRVSFHLGRQTQEGRAPRSAPTPRDPPSMPGRRRPFPSARLPPRLPPRVSPPRETKERRAGAVTAPPPPRPPHTRRLPITRTKPTAEDVPRPRGRPHGFPTCLHTPGG